MPRPMTMTFSSNFPSPWDAPAAILGLESHCGPLVIWGIARYFRRRVSAGRIVRDCNHTSRDGVATICIAVSLARLGLTVQFFTDPDPSPRRDEKRCYGAAERLGVRLAPSLNRLLSVTTNGCIPIVFFMTPEGDGHFSPLLGEDKNDLILPYTDTGRIDRRTFLRSWRADGILRQCLLVSRSG
jgi:hypothetical protein